MTIAPSLQRQWSYAQSDAPPHDEPSALVSFPELDERPSEFDEPFPELDEPEPLSFPVSFPFFVSEPVPVVPPPHAQTRVTMPNVVDQAEIFIAKAPYGS